MKPADHKRWRDLARHIDPDLLKRLVDSGAYTFKTPSRAPRPRSSPAASPLLDGVTGLYLEECNEAKLMARAPEGAGGGVAPYALDPANSERLWDLSLQLIA